MTRVKSLSKSASAIDPTAVRILPTASASRQLFCPLNFSQLVKLNMVNVISCQAAAILLVAMAACAVATPWIGKEKRNVAPDGLLAALGGLSARGDINARSLPKKTRSIRNGSMSAGSNPNCGHLSSVNVHTGSDAMWANAESIMPIQQEWAEMISSATKSGVSHLAIYGFTVLALVFVLVREA
ncbi:hypothetical protein PoB_000969100 [Plakobranchus ocellatus]|uniref:Uncharacterized protein n=1 Tax=Plakobranchus ocellatus TaxID=259542 RepID=A0AAV3YLB4_9GAST|nr:hypothetical protein PoB_000969100 [Plakobranchus ocellatus]